MAKSVVVPIRVSPEVRGAIRREMEHYRAEIEEEAHVLPRETLASLLGLDQSQDTPTWTAIFEAVDSPMEVPRGKR